MFGFVAAIRQKTNNKQIIIIRPSARFLSVGRALAGKGYIGRS